MQEDGAGAGHRYIVVNSSQFIQQELISIKAIMGDKDAENTPPEYAHIPKDQLKHGKGRFSHIILVPQPSDDPNDPLNVRSL